MEIKETNENMGKWNRN